MTAKLTKYFGILTALTLTAAAAVVGALLIASGPASAQEGDCTLAGYIYPTCNQTGVARDTDVSVAGMFDSTTVNTSTFTLVKQSTNTPVAAWVSFEAYCLGEGYFCGAVLDPQDDLEANITYTATLKGGENGIKRDDGTPMLAQDYSWSFTTGDTTSPPDTTITSAPCSPKQVGNDIYWGPCDPIASRSASIAFTSSKANSTFECKLDGAAFSSCTSPQSYTGLSDGTHSFQVRATDSSGNTDPTPDSTGWTVDATAPTISITSPTDGATYQQGASIYASYSCSDSADSSPQCTGTVPNGSAIDTSTTGTKTFTVTATDWAGNMNWKTVTYYVTKTGKARR